MDKITAIVCTYNRCESLRDTLNALAGQEISSGWQCEVLVVDNNSSDGTRKVVEETRRESGGNIRYLFEPNQGKSFALNRAIREAKGNVLAFTDDDIVPDSDWLKQIGRAFEDPQIDCVGGKIDPLWLSTPPNWMFSPVLKNNFWRIYALLDHGDKALRADGSDENFLYGASIAFRAGVFNEVGFYRTDLGPTANGLSRGEDTDMMNRVLRAGKAVLYDPSIRVKHKVEAERVSLRYARKRRYDGARSDFRRGYGEPGRLPVWYFMECLKNGAKAFMNYISGKKDKGIHFELLFWVWLGRIRGGLDSLCQKSR